MATQLTKKQDNESLEALLQRPGYQARFKEVLQEKAPQFCSSLVSIGRSMGDVDAKSIVGAGMIAACLDLPIDRNLGFAWIVPYRRGDKKFAQFQVGYKGYVQLAQRTGYYAGMNACPINKEAYGGRDSIGEPIILWDKLDEAQPAVGYVFAFKMVNGFTKVCYWTKEKVIEHARKYSQAYRAGGDTPWKSHFDKMAMKTVIANELSDWGILSIQFQLARKSDQGVKTDIDAEVEYIDTTNGAGENQIEDRKPEPTGHQQATQSQSQKPDPKNAKTEQKPAQDAPNVEKPVETPKEPEKPTGEPAANENKAPETTAATTAEPSSKVETTAQNAQQDPESVIFEQVAPEGQPPGQQGGEKPPFVVNPNETPELQNVRKLLYDSGKTEQQLIEVLRNNKAMRDDQKSISELSSKKYVNISIAWNKLVEQM